MPLSTDSIWLSGGSVQYLPRTADSHLVESDASAALDSWFENLNFPDITPLEEAFFRKYKLGYPTYLASLIHEKDQFQKITNELG